MQSFLVVLFVVPCALAAAVGPPEDWWSSVADCRNADIVPCLGVKMVALMSRAARSDVLEVVEGVSFVGTGDRSGRALSEAELQNSLPEEPSQKTSRLFDLFLDAALRFLKTHTLQFKLPENTNLQRAFEEGRGKLKKTFLPIIIGVAAKVFAIIPLILGGLALIAAKALLFSKIALALAGIIGLQKLLGGAAVATAGLAGLGGKFGGGGGGGGGGGSYSSHGSGGWSTGPASGGWSSGGGGPYYRSFDEKSAQDIAYSAQAPHKTQ